MAKVLFEKPGTQSVITVKTLWIIFLVIFSVLLGLSIYVLPFLFTLGLLLALIFSLFIFHYPYMGILVYLFITIARPQEFLIGLGGVVGLERVMAIVVLISLLLSPKIREQRLIVRSPINWAMLGLLGVMIASTVTAVWKGQAIDTSIEFTKTLIFYFLIVNILDTQPRLKGFLWMYLLCIGFMAVSSLYLYFTGDPYIRMGIQRATGISKTFEDPNAVAMNLALAFPFLFIFTREEGFWLKTLRVVLIILSVTTVILTGSRAGMITSIIFALIFSLRSNKKIPALAISIVLLFLAWTLMPHQYQERFMTVFKPELSESAAASAQGRIVGLKMGVKMFLDHPFMGVGAGNFPTAWALLYSGEGPRVWMQPHNMIGQLLGELGFLGLIAFLFFLFVTFREIFRTRRNLDRGSWLYQSSKSVEVSLLLLLISGLFGHNLYRYSWYFLAALTVVLVQLSAEGE
jgi:probable O-glycosylation ligase (exosortase A-associated)